MALRKLHLILFLLENMIYNICFLRKNDIILNGCNYLKNVLINIELGGIFYNGFELGTKNYKEPSC